MFMKEIKLVLLAALCMTMFSLTSCSDDDDFKPENIFKEALIEKYPKATHIEWEKKRAYTVADCRIDGKDVDVWFTADAKWQMTETELLMTDLPEAVKAALDDVLAPNGAYAAWRVDDRDFLEYVDGTSVYVIEVEQRNKEFDLYFSPSGELVDEVDVTTGDDTHWPK